MKLLSITGTGRSGSTVLEMLIARQTGGVSVGEIKYLWSRGLIRNELCSCGEKTHDCQFWKTVLAQAFPDGLNPEETESLRLRVERHRHFVLHRLLKRQSDDYLRDRAAYIDILRRLFQAIQNVSGARLVLDGSKDPAHVDLVAEAMEDTAILHLVRDSRGMAYSWATPKIRKEVHWTEEYIPALSTLHAVRDWLFINIGSEAAFARSPRYMRVRYEDIAAGKLDIGALCARLDLPEGSSFPAHSVSGNPMRFDDAPVRLTPDVRWLSSYSPGRKALVTLLTAPLLWRYGYPLWPKAGG